MSIIQNSGVVAVEKRRYLVGIVALVLPSSPHSPMVMGRVMMPQLGQLTQQDLLHSILSAAGSLGMYHLRQVFGACIFWDFLPSRQIMRSRLFEHFTKMSPAFIRPIGRGL